MIILGNMKLNSRIIGDGPDLIILHGLYGSGDNWLTVARQFADHFRVHLPDARNHGHSPHDPELSYKAMVADLIDYLEEHQISSPIIMGHSMGGKTAMWLSILHPQRVSKLIIVDISPVSYAQLNKPSNLVEDHLNIVNAMRSVDLTHLKTRTEIDKEFAEYIHSDIVRQFLLKSIDREKNGKYSWKLNIESISNGLPEVMSGIDVEKYKGNIRPNLPVLFIRGELSEYIPDKDIEAIKTLYPTAVIETIFDASHWVHAEQPEAFISVLRHFLLPT